MLEAGKNSKDFVGVPLAGTLFNISQNSKSNAEIKILHQGTRKGCPYDSLINFGQREIQNVVENENPAIHTAGFFIQ